MYQNKVVKGNKNMLCVILRYLGEYNYFVKCSGVEV